MPDPRVERRRATNATTTSTMTAAMAHHHLLMNPETLSNMRVGSGSLAFSEAKNVRNLGSTKVARTTTVHDGHDRRRRPDR